MDDEQRKSAGLSKAADGWWYCDRCNYGIGRDLASLNRRAHAMNCPARWKPGDGPGWCATVENGHGCMFLVVVGDVERHATATEAYEVAEACTRAVPWTREPAGRHESDIMQCEGSLPVITLPAPSR
jgi:hypothetical protein